MQGTIKLLCQIGQDRAIAEQHVKIVSKQMEKIQALQKVCQSSYFQIRNINTIRKLLPQETAENLVHAFIYTSCLDNGNALLNGISEHHLKKLQLVQNAAARVLRTYTGYLRVKRIKYKTLLLTWKGLNNVAPSYISDLLSPYSPARSLRSADKQLLTIPRTKSSIRDHAFSVSAPKLWNSLPTEIRQKDCLQHFKSGLKTFLFNVAYFS